MADDYDEFRKKESLKQSLRREDRDATQLDKRIEYSKRRRDRETEIEDRHKKGLEKQQERHKLSKEEFDRRQGIKHQDSWLQEEAKLEGLSRQFNHNSGISKQIHEQSLEQDRQRLQSEITLLNGQLKGEIANTQTRYDGELTLQKERNKLELERVELQAEWDYQETIGAEAERTNREISVAQEQTERELALAQANNNHDLALEKIKNLIHLDQKSQELAHYKARLKADTEVYQLKEDRDLERRMIERREAFKEKLVDTHAEISKMKLASRLTREEFTHEQETLLRMRKLAFDLGLDTEGLSDKEISEMVAEFQESLP